MRPKSIRVRLHQSSELSFPQYILSKAHYYVQLCDLLLCLSSWTCYFKVLVYLSAAMGIFFLILGAYSFSLLEMESNLYHISLVPFTCQCWCKSRHCSLHLLHFLLPSFEWVQLFFLFLFPFYKRIP